MIGHVPLARYMNGSFAPWELVTRPLVTAGAEIGSRPRRLADQMLGESPRYGHWTLVVLGNVRNVSSTIAVGLGKRRRRKVCFLDAAPGWRHPQSVPCQRGRRVARAARKRQGRNGRACGGARPGWGAG
jgi:hypothetical protein